MRADDSVAERFWKKVSRDGAVPQHAPQLGPCWIWLASCAGGKYGKFRIDGVYYGAHRTSWTLESGPIPDGLFVLHKCDNVRCVRPAHLFLGTHQQNVDDRNAKGRQARGDAIRVGMPPEHGELNPAAKLTDDKVRQIRAARGRQVDIAAEFGVDQTTISKIRLRKAWTHVA